MLWLEMSRDEEHGGGDWGFTKCLWSPVHKHVNGSIGSTWPYWENLIKVEAGDSILHLRGTGQNAKFIGFSTAATDGFKTSERPPNPGQWGYDTVFYKVPLKDYQPLKQSIMLKKVFDQNDEVLRNYYYKNRYTIHKKSLFFVVQSNRLQCQNGAYLTEVDTELASIIFGNDYSINSNPKEHTACDERIQQLAVRVGQKEFSDNVKINYNNHCCFPNCSITEKGFLVGSHIARWADAPELRGDTSNGLCFCVLHDKAFELGYFTLDDNFKVMPNEHNPAIMQSSLYKTYIEPYKDQPIKLGLIKPSIDSLSHHWERLGFH